MLEKHAFDALVAILAVTSKKLGKIRTALYSATRTDRHMADDSSGIFILVHAVGWAEKVIEPTDCSFHASAFG